MEKKDIIFEIQDLKKHYPIQSGLLKKKTGCIKALDGISHTLFLIDPRVFAGVTVKAHCLQFKAKGSLIENDPDQKHGGNGNQDSPVDAGLRKQLIHPHLGDLGRDRHILGLIAQVIKQRLIAFCNPVDHVHSDIVHHNGGDDLVYIKVCF